ncbi:UdgX family uracil-DNA binding protein [Caenimonas sp. SL110]|uniref:UdgX family uracil-DNA binding protein n=1 Tax=Caenimonas sp. SL110 TaxID=1450524 RepID=UPI0006548078|nr:UdgX family uracil-DNA binding protein [Caenimonas sp. SL110]
MRVQLDGEVDIAGFRAQARQLLAAGVRPELVQWTTSAQTSDLFAQDCASQAPAVIDAHCGLPQAVAPLPRVPAAFIELCESVVLHSDPQRFALMYQLLWRLAHEPGLRHDPLDEDMLRAQQMAKAVRHDIHKMRAFVRFREVPDDAAPGGVRHVAWFEPMHHIVQANAPWFMRRFTQMNWVLLTPRCCAAWDGSKLTFRPGASREEAPAADAGEQHWLTYYRSIFNPARLKLAMMQKEMPRKYWHNLPEASLISSLAAQAMARAGGMIDEAPTQPVRKVSRLARPARPAIPLIIESPDELKQATQNCRDCPIGATATQAVNGDGPQRAKLMFVGEQPGDQEDLAGRAFVGPAGHLFQRALERLGIRRDEIFVTNAVRHFKFELRGKRRIHKTPTQAEAAACLHWLEREIQWVQPHALVALGATASRSLLGRSVAVMSERGRWHTSPGGLPVMVTVHPSALLRMDPHLQPAAFEQFVADLALATALASPPGLHLVG